MARRRKKNPYIPGKDRVPAHLVPEIKQLGLPTPERAQHGDFDADNLTPHSPGAGVLRARSKTLFMLPEQKAALIERAIQDLRNKGVIEIKPDDVLLPQTSIDRNFLPGEYSAISWFLRVHAIVEGSGRPGMNSYEPRASSGGSGERLPFSEDEQFDRREYAHVACRLPEAHLVLLDWFTWCMFPEEFTNRGKPPSKVQVGSSMFEAEDAKYLRGGVDGHFKAVCQNVAHWRADYEIHQRRLALAANEYSKYRRLAAE